MRPLISMTQPCRVLNTTLPVRAMMLGDVDDCTALRYLLTCSMLHAGHHEYPVKRAMSTHTCNKLSPVAWYTQRDQRWPLGTPVQCLMVGIGLRDAFKMFGAATWFFDALRAPIALLCFMWAVMWLVQRPDCCNTRWWHTWRRRRCGMPRVKRLSGELSDARPNRHTTVHARHSLA